MFIENHGINETFALAGFSVAFKRARGPFVLNVFLPTGMLTFISFIGFLIPVDIVPGRMALLVTIFLMLVNISAQERYQTSKPVVSTCHVQHLKIFICGWISIVCINHNLDKKLDTTGYVVALVHVHCCTCHD